MQLERGRSGWGARTQPFPYSTPPFLFNSLYTVTQLWLAPECLPSGSTWNTLRKEPEMTPSRQLLSQNSLCWQTGPQPSTLRPASYVGPAAGWVRIADSHQTVKVFSLSVCVCVCARPHTNSKTTSHPNYPPSGKLGSSGHRSCPDTQRTSKSIINCSLNCATWTLLLPKLQNSTRVWDERTDVLYCSFGIY